MAPKKHATEPQAFFSDGIALGPASLVTSAGFNEAPEAATSRIYLKFDEEWMAHEVSGDFIVSVDYSDGLLFALGKNGIVKMAGKRGRALSPETVVGKFTSVKITDTEERGQLARIRCVGPNAFVCGWGGQIYRISGDGWSRMERGLDPKRDDTILDIAGLAEDDMYAVGLQGVLLHFDGNRWTYLDSPTNNHLYSIKCLAKDDVILVGAQGGLYRGAGSRWQFVGEKNRSVNLWSVESFKGALYITYGDRGLLRVARGAFRDVDFELPFKTHTHRLSATSDILLSFGSDHILASSDGLRWSEVVCPDNE